MDDPSSPAGTPPTPTPDSDRVAAASAAEAEEDASRRDVERHFPHTAKLLQGRTGKSESPGREQAGGGDGRAGVPEDTSQEATEAADAFSCQGANRGGGDLEARLEKANARRTRLLEERRRALAEAANHRQEILKHVSALRREAVRAFVQKAPPLLAHLWRAGLMDSVGKPQEVIEHILVTDPRVCAECNSSSAEGAPLVLPQICPKTGKPHRRSLVACAEALLKLIGDTKVNLLPSKPCDGGGASNDAIPASEAAGGTTKRSVAKRGITVQPHLLVLAFYHAARLPTDGLRFSSGAGGDDDGAEQLLYHNAVHLVQTIGQLFVVLQRASATASVAESGPDNDGSDPLRYISQLLSGFAATWRQYAKLAQASGSASGGGSGGGEQNYRAARDELIKATKDAFVATQVAVRVPAARVVTPLSQPPSPLLSEERAATEANSTAELQRFSDMMLERLLQLGGPAAVEQAVHEADAKVAATARLLEEQEAQSRGKKQNATDSVKPLTDVVDQQSQGQEQRSRSTAGVDGGSVGSDVSPPVTPEHRPRSISGGAHAIPPIAPLLSYYSTGSDSDREVRPAATGSDAARAAAAAAASLLFGPTLPPNWFVDQDGVSRPPPPAATAAATPEPPSDTTTRSAAPSPQQQQQAMREKRERLERRARAAFQAKFNIKEPESLENAVAQRVMESMRDAAFDALTTDLNQNPPVLDRLPFALASVAESLVDALPKRLRSRIGKEVRDVLDWNTVRRLVRNSEQHIAELMSYVVARVCELGAPAREEALRTECRVLEQRLQAREEPLGVIVVAILRFMLDAIRQLKQDIADFTMTMISNELVQNAAKYHEELLRECFPPSCEWSRTIAFLQDQLNDADKIASLVGANEANLSSAGAVSLREKQLRAAVYLGAVDALRSANRTSDDRWSLFPHEAFVIEKQVIVSAANTVQQCTLRLMIGGTVSMLLQRIKFRPQQLQVLLTNLDTKLTNEWLPKVANLAELQSAVVGEVNTTLLDEGKVLQATALSDAETTVLNNVIAKMTDTCSPQYVTFENRVVAAVRQAMLLPPKEASSVPVETRPATIGLASVSAFRCGAQLRLVLDYHWEVLRPFYVDMSAALAFPSTTTE